MIDIAQAMWILTCINTRLANIPEAFMRDNSVCLFDGLGSVMSVPMLVVWVMKNGTIHYHAYIDQQSARKSKLRSCGEVSL